MPDPRERDGIWELFWSVEQYPEPHGQRWLSYRWPGIEFELPPALPIVTCEYLSPVSVQSDALESVGRVNETPYLGIPAGQAVLREVTERLDGAQFVVVYTFEVHDHDLREPRGSYRAMDFATLVPPGAVAGTTVRWDISPTEEPRG